MVSYYSIPFAASKAEDFDTDSGHPADSHQGSIVPGGSQPATGAVSYYGSLGGRGLKRAGTALSAADAAVRGGQAGLQSLQRRQALGSINAARSVEELQSVLTVRLAELDAFSCTAALHRLARLSHDVDKGVSQRTQRQWRDSRSAKVRSHPSWRILLESLGTETTLREAEPRQLANMAWAVARLRADDGLQLLCSAAVRCAERTGPGTWDAMSTSLIPWSFATLTAKVQEVQKLVKSVGQLVHEQGSSYWTPGDLSRVAWSWAKLAEKDDAFFRRCSCLVIARLPEYTPSQLAQTIWAFATVAPSDACTHLLPKAAAAMLEGRDDQDLLAGLHAYTPQHLAMAVWSFAAVLYRPEDLLKEIGEAVPYKLEKLNPQDISTTAWAFTTLLAKDRTIYDVLAATSIRTIQEFNNQDLSNTVWAFASAGEYHAEFLEAVAAETCRRPDFHGQHLAMVAWAFVTLRHRHDQLLSFIGEMTNGSRGLGTWSNAKLLAFTFAGLPRLGNALLGNEQWTLGAMQRLLQHFHERLKQSQSVDADDAWVVHDAILPWLGLDSRITGHEGWQALTKMLSAQRESLTSFLESEDFGAILASEKPKETAIIRRYQESIQTFRIRGLGSEHSWRFLSRLGVLRSTEHFEIGDEIRSSKQIHGRGERQNWCYFRSRVHVNGVQVAEPGRLLNSTVVKYREDCAGLVHVKLHHDRVDHRAWDAEFRAMARTAAAARSLLSAVPGHQDMAQELLATGARTGSEIPCGAGGEEQVEGLLELFMTEVPCLSCMCAMAQFRRRFPGITLKVLWDGLPPEAHFG